MHTKKNDDLNEIIISGVCVCAFGQNDALRYISNNGFSGCV